MGDWNWIHRKWGPHRQKLERMSFFWVTKLPNSNSYKGWTKIQFSISIQMPVTMIFPTRTHLLGSLLSPQTLHQIVTIPGLQSPGSSVIYHEWKPNLGAEQDVIVYFTPWPQVTSEWDSTGNLYSGVFLESWLADLRLWWTGEAHRSWVRIDQGSGAEWSVPSKEQIWLWRKQNELLGRRQEDG